jgi:hypothetical protein
MEIINKRHEQIFKNERVELASYIRFDESGDKIYFSAGAAREFGLQPGLTAHFINDENHWLFYCDDDKDGFKLFGRKNKKAIEIFNASLVNLFVKRNRVHLPSKYPLKLSNAKLDGKQLIEINLNKQMT